MRLKGDEKGFGRGNTATEFVSLDLLGYDQITYLQARQSLRFISAFSNTFFSSPVFKLEGPAIAVE